MSISECHPSPYSHTRFATTWVSFIVLPEYDSTSRGLSMCGGVCRLRSGFRPIWLRLGRRKDADGMFFSHHSRGDIFRRANRHNRVRISPSNGRLASQYVFRAERLKVSSHDQMDPRPLVAHGWAPAPANQMVECIPSWVDHICSWVGGVVVCLIG